MTTTIPYLPEVAISFFLNVQEFIKMETNPTAYFFFTDARDLPDCILPIEPPLNTLTGRCVVGKLQFVTGDEVPQKRGYRTFVLTNPLHISLNNGMGKLTMQPKPNTLDQGQ